LPTVKTLTLFYCQNHFYTFSQIKNMLNLFKKKEQKDPVCGMAADEKFISKYGEKFCSENCVKKYEEQNQIAGEEHSKKSSGCCG